MKKIFIILLILSVIGVALWLVFRKAKITTKAQAIKIIATYTGIDASAYQSMGDSYLISRAIAIKSGSETFSDASQSYFTKTGKNVTTKETSTVDTPVIASAPSSSWIETFINGVKNI